MSAELLSALRNEVKRNGYSDLSYWERRKALKVKRSNNIQDTRIKKRLVRDTGAVSSPGTELPTSVGEKLRDKPPSATSQISVEWSGVTGGPPAEVVLRLHPPGTNARGNSTVGGGSGVVVRAEEALIVAFVLLLWIAAIALFFNRWGKIRMLEPYQPKFQQQHRQSCALAESSVVVPPHHRASLSRGCLSYDCGIPFPPYQTCGYISHRPRQNSVFVGSVGAMALIPESPPRRSRSATDLPALMPLREHSVQPTPRSSRAASLHSAVDLRVCVPSPRTSRAASLHSGFDMPGAVQVHVRGSATNVNRPRSPRRLTVTNV